MNWLNDHEMADVEAANSEIENLNNELTSLK